MAEESLISALIGINNQQMAMLGEIKASVAETRQAVLDLAGPEGRVTKLERSKEWEGKKQWIHTSLIVPITLLIDVVIRKLGGTS